MSPNEPVKAKKLPDLPLQSEELAEALRLLAAQVQVSLKDTETPYNELAGLFAELADLQGDASIGDDENQAADSREQIYAQAVIAFQFYDRMCQRLMAVTDGLNGLAQYVAGDTAELLYSDSIIKDHASLYSVQQLEELENLMQGRTQPNNKDKKRLYKGVPVQSKTELF